MYMNLKPNKHKRISINTTTMASLGFIGPPKIYPPKKNLIFFPGPPNYFGLEFRSPPSPPLPPKIRGPATMTKQVKFSKKRTFLTS